MNLNKAFPSKFLKAADAEENDLMLTIDRITIETVGTDQKLIAHWRESQKPMVLNKSNAKMIAKLAKSDDTDDWAGTKVRIIATEVEFQGDLVPSLRIREAKAKRVEADDEPPF